MKEIKLMNLTLKNFKGIKSLELDASGNDLKVYGDNATGKTSIFDGFLWLLFNKDSFNRAEFGIKTLEGGKEVHNLEHEVSAVLTVAGVPLSLRKVFKEKWTKKRGAPIAEFTGHETNHFIDGVPVKKKEYEEKIGSIAKEEVFRLLTNPLYFNEQVKWQDRRNTLLEVCGDIEFDDVIEFNRELKDLPAILKGRAIEDHRKVIAARRAEINKELERIPVRIDELNNSMPDNASSQGLETKAAELGAQISENETLINNINNGAFIIDRQQKLRQVEMDIEQIKHNFSGDSDREINELKVKLQEEQSNVSILEVRKNQKLETMDYKQNRLEPLAKQREELLNKWHAVNGRTFSHETACACPTCGQDLPEEQVAAAEQKALADYNLKKSAELDKIKNEGFEVKELIDSINSELVRHKEETDELNTQIERKMTAAQKLQDKISSLMLNKKDVSDSSEYRSKAAEADKLQAEIAKLKANAAEAATDVQQQNVELRAKLKEVNAKLADIEQAKKMQIRIVELEEQQKELADEFENLERELYLTEQFIRSKVELLESKINSKFQTVRFKLFKQQVNGRLEEICETTVNGVPYNAGLNNAARINAGIDIINTLTEHFNFRAPIFVDNAEAVTRIAETDSQLISLVVSEPDKQLRIETQTDKESEVA